MTTAAEGGAPGSGDTGKLCDIVDDIASRLIDPKRVAAIATAPDNVDQYPGGPEPRPPWDFLGLGEAHAGLALLYAELSHTDSRYRHAAHAHLTAAAQGLRQSAGPGLFAGTASLAFAAVIARHTEDDYADLLAVLDTKVTSQLRTLLAREARRLATRQAGVSMHSYDTISGVTGLGRYLLLRGGIHRPLLIDALAYLVRLTEPVEAHGHQVPGWWAPTKPSAVGPEYHRGHFNLGLAHGISGPLALLSLARQHGVCVPGQQTAMVRIVDHLISQQTTRGLWPAVTDFDTFIKGPDQHTPRRSRTAWCYGTPGTARAIQLAGTALERADWQTLSIDAMITALRKPMEETPADSSLCHGWAGVLHTAALMARDSGDPRLIRELPALASELQSAYRPDLPFCYAYNYPFLRSGFRVATHRAGFLEGSAGIALTLHAYVKPRLICPWNTALLVA